MPLRNLVYLAIATLISVACYQVVAKNRHANLFAEAIEIIEREALHPHSSEDLFIAAMNGMLSELDIHSQFIHGSSFRQFNEDIKQEFGGVGIRYSVDPDSKRIVVLAPIPGSPAFRAGVQIGDEIVAVDGQSVSGNESQVNSMIRGPVGQSVKLTLLRQGVTVDKQMERAIIKTETVGGDHRLPDGRWRHFIQEYPRIGYIQIDQFAERTKDELELALREIRDQVDGLIIDLRDNTGGLLNSAVDICDLFIDSGELIVSIRRRDETSSEIRAKSEPIVSTDLPLVVLINRSSASASEIVAGCLQDHGRAIVIGEQSYGKGTVQNLIPMQRGVSALKLTTSSYWRPSGKPIDRRDESTKENGIWGVQPNQGFQIKLTPEEKVTAMQYRSLRGLAGMVGADDEQLQQAFDRMRRSLERIQANEPDADDLKEIQRPFPEDDEVPEKLDGRQKQNVESPKTPATDPSSTPADTAPRWDEFVDPTLQKAIDYLKPFISHADVT